MIYRFPNGVPFIALNAVFVGTDYSSTAPRSAEDTSLAYRAR